MTKTLTLSTRVLWALLMLGTIASSYEESGYYCQSETFKAKCWANEAIIMKRAEYGRMSLGRCVIADLGYIGCKADVLHLADRWCSGRRTCEIQVPRGELDEANTCYQELKTYLEAAYTCVRVAIADSSECSSAPHVKLQQPEGHISSEVTDETGCGGRNAPWVMEARSGQILNVTLLSFGFKESASHKTRQIRPESSCLPIGYIVERNPKRNETICAGEEREMLVYTSKSSKVEITILDEATRQGFLFMLNYELFGCPDLFAPENAYYTRTGDKAEIGCKTAERTWHLTCVGNKWKGVIGNCTAPGLPSSTDKMTSSSFMLTKELSIVIVLSLALGVALLILAVGFAFLVRMKRTSREKFPLDAKMSACSGVPIDGSKPFYHVIRGDTDSATVPYPLHSDKVSDGNEYAHTTQNMSTFSDSDYGSQSNSSFVRQGGGCKGGYHDGSYDLDKGRGSASVGSTSSTYVGPRYFVLDREMTSPDGSASRQDVV